MAEQESFPIVGVGASAGGIEAMKGFFRGIPDPFGAAIVVVTHLNPERDSVLAEVLATFTTLPVTVAADGMPAQADHVYVMPPGAVLGIRGGRFTLTPLGAGVREVKPVDLFLTALALDQGARAVAVILSGGDADGTIGVKAVKEHDGLTFAQAQDSDGPETPDMPLSALKTGHVDFGVPASRMGALIAAYRPGQDEAGPGDPAAGDVSEAMLAEIYRLLARQVGHDFSGYKVSTFRRRLFRRIGVVGDGRPATYLERLRADPAEAAALFRDLLIGVTKFFRDTEAFEALAAQVVPKLFSGREPEDTVRVWVPACSTGEEVYSIAILLREHMDTLEAPPRVQIFATDIDERSLAVARGGRYPKAYLDAVAPQRRARHFTHDGESLVVAANVRDLCTFAPHSVLRDPPFSRLDLVSCRNMLIYLGHGAQERILPTLHYALRPRGYLFIGMAENVTRFEDLFATIDKKHRIFQARDTVLPLRLPAMAGDTWSDARSVKTVKHREATTHASLSQVVDAQMLAEFAPPHAVVTRAGEAVHYSERIGTYLRIASGQPTHDLAAMTRKGLRLELRTALREAIEGNVQVVRPGLEIELADGRLQRLSLTVKPLTLRPEAEPLFLVVFNEVAPPVDRLQRDAQAEIERGDELRRLEEELTQTRERLQAIVEEYETSIEELKSANEELCSVNEEMQSANEELEASKEEVQSINEELHTVNTELGAKVDALDQLANDQAALFESTDIASVFLDTELHIRTFTQAAASIFGIRPSDRGRSLSTFAAPFPTAWLPGDARTLLAEGTTPERLLDGADGARYRARLTASRRDGAGVSGLIVNFSRLPDESGPADAEPAADPV